MLRTRFFLRALPAEFAPGPGPGLARSARSLAPAGQNSARLYENRARAYVRRRLGLRLRRRVASDDVLQDVLLAAEREFQEKPKRSNMTGLEFFRWLTVLIDNRIKNLARHHIHSKRRTALREVALDSSAAVSVDAGGRTPSSIFLEKERAGLIEAALPRLTRREREVIELIYFQQLSVSEAASRMGKTHGATAVLHSAALKKLREVVKPKEN